MRDDCNGDDDDNDYDVHCDDDGNDNFCDDDDGDDDEDNDAIDGWDELGQRVSKIDTNPLTSPSAKR